MHAYNISHRHMVIYTYNAYTYTQEQICDGCLRFQFPEWQRKSELRMESNLLKTDCLSKGRRGSSLPKSAKKKKKKAYPAVLSRMLLITTQDKKLQLK